MLCFKESIFINYLELAYSQEIQDTDGFISDSYRNKRIVSGGLILSKDILKMHLDDMRNKGKTNFPEFKNYYVEEKLKEIYRSGR